MENTFTLTLHMVASVDGMIAKKDNSLSWMEAQCFYEKGVSGDNSEETLKAIDCYVMGSRTYEHAMELSKTYGWAYGDKRTIVVTSRNLSDERKNIEFYAGDLAALVAEKLKPTCNNVWLVGGSTLAKAFLKLKLVDEIRMTILPVILGDGLLFFDYVEQEQTLQLKDAKAYKNGMLDVCYQLKRS